MKKSFKSLLPAFILFLFYGTAFGGSMPFDIGHITHFLTNSTYFNDDGNGNYFEALNSYNFSGQWDYTAIAFESGNINWVKEATSGPETFTTAAPTGFGIYDTVNFDNANLYFSDTDNPINLGLDSFSINSDYFRVYRLLNDSNPLNYFNNGKEITLSAGTLIVGFNDNYIYSSTETQNNDSDFDDIIVAMGPAPVPEPATMLLLGTGLLGIAGIGRKKLKK